MGKVGRYGMFGGQYVPETVMNAVHELEAAYEEAKADPTFWEEYRTLCRIMQTVHPCCIMQNG